MDQPTHTLREITPGATLAPAPAWADRTPYDIPAQPNPHFIANGICVLMDDSQMDLTTPERAWYYRRAELVTAHSGAEQAAQFNIAFDPAFQRLEIHDICVVRNGQRIDHTQNAMFEVLRRERNMERMLFDGSLTVHLTLPDVRQGDVVESCYTTYGMRKTLGGRHSAFIGLEWPVGILDVRLRQRAPKSRVITEKRYNGAPEGEQIESDGVIDRRWRLKERPGIRYEPLAPPWVFQGAALQLTEWKDWAEVAAAFTPLYEDDQPLPEDVEQEIARLSAEPNTAKRAAGILRYVQSNVRYLAISIGEGGYTPRKLTDIGASRYGDCKDKSKLYVHMARRLGVDACPALVNTRDGYSLMEWLPSGQLFDHCIVRIAIDGKVYWVDPTMHPQASPLGTMSQCHFGWALPLKPGATGLERMIDPPILHLSETHEEVHLGDGPAAPVRYQWRHTFRGVRAEGIRDQLARDGSVGVFRAYAEDVQRVWDKAKVVKQEVVTDDVETNTITLHEEYEISGAWAQDEGDKWKFATLDLMLNRMLAKLDAGEREYAIYLGHPGRRTRHVDIHFVVPIAGEGWSYRVDGTTIALDDQMRVISPRHLVLEQMLRIDAMTLPAAEAETYRKIQTRLLSSEIAIAQRVNKKGKFVRENGDGEGALSVIVNTLLRVLPFIALGVYFYWRWVGDQPQ